MNLFSAILSDCREALAQGKTCRLSVETFAPYSPNTARKYLHDEAKALGKKYRISLKDDTITIRDMMPTAQKVQPEVLNVSSDTRAGINKMLAVRKDSNPLEGKRSAIYTNKHSPELMAIYLHLLNQSVVEFVEIDEIDATSLKTLYPKTTEQLSVVKTTNTGTLLM